MAVDNLVEADMRVELLQILLQISHIQGKKASTLRLCSPDGANWRIAGRSGGSGQGNDSR